MRLSCSFLLLLVSGLSTADAQRLHVERLSTENGLPSATLFDLTQDPSGRIWIAGRGGVTAYDGRSFRAFGVADGLPNLVYEDLEADADGRIWTVTRAPVRVYYRAGASWHQLPEPPAGGLPYNWGTSLAVTSGPERVVVGTTKAGLGIWDGEAWSRLTAAEGLPSDHVTALAVAGGRTFVGTSGGLCTLEAWKPDGGIRRSDPRLSRQILALRPAPAHEEPRLWILGNTWLGYLEDDRLTVAVEGLRILTPDPRTKGALALDRAGGVFFGSPQQVYFLNPEERRVRTLGMNEGLIAAGTTSLLVDREENVWIGGMRGLSKIESFRFLSYDRDQGLLENEVSAVIEAPPGRLVFGHNKGLTVLEDGLVGTVPFGAAAGDSQIRVLDMATGRDGQVWVASRELGLLRLTDEGGWEVELERDAMAVELDHEGKLWVSTWLELFRRDPTGWTRIETGIEPERPASMRWLNSAADGRFFVSTVRGLLWLEEGTWRRAIGPTDESNNVYHVLADAAGEVWVGTVGGLFTLRDHDLVKVSRGDLDIDRPVYFILEDRRGQLWFGTDDGVRVWSSAGQLRHFTSQHGLAGRETNRGAGFVDHRGRVWIGTEQGVSMYQEAYDTGPGAAPRLEVRGLEVNGERQALTGDVTLRHDQNNLTFFVDTIFFSNEEEILYRHRLEGYEEAAQGPETLAGPLRYTNLPAGSYRLRISAGWTGGAWSDEVLSAAIVIPRPWWRRWWFFTAAGTGLALTLLSIHGLRTRTIRSRARELESLNAELREQMDQRRRAEAERELLISELETRNAELERFTYTVSHDLKSPLVTVRGFVGLLEKDAGAGNTAEAKRDIEHIKMAVGQMGRLLDELLDLSRIGRVVNPSEEVRLDDLARRALELSGAQISARGVRAEVADDLPTVWGDRTRLLEVLQNLVENAVKYMGDQPEPRISIGARRDGTDCLCYVRDNGIGIPPEYQEKVFGLFERLDSRTDGTGVGLALVKRIVELHGGRVWVESEGRGRGSTFFFTLPGPEEKVILRPRS